MKLFSRRQNTPPVDAVDLIKPPRVIFEGFDWSRVDRLKPTGAAHRDRLLGARSRFVDEDGGNA